MTSKGYTFTPEGYIAQSTGRNYSFTPENAIGKGYAPEEEEGFWKSAARTALQIPQGIAEATGPGIAAGLFQLGALGESDLDIDTWHKLRELAEQEGREFDEEAYEQARQEMLGMIPTISNIASKIEKETGVPLEPKTATQKALRLGSTAGKFQPGTLGQKATAGIAAPAISHGLQEAGLPEVFSDPLGLGLAIPAGAKGPKFNIGQAKKPSGLPERYFEGITKPTEVPAKKIQQINDKIESDFRDISDKIIKESPIGETAKNLAEDPLFKQESRELLNQAQEIADATPGDISSKNIKKELADITAKNVKGYSLGEYDKSYLKYMKEALDDIVGENVTHGQLVEQYRKNNKSLGEYFEPGSSKALNRAKKDSLLDQNRAIANLIEKSNPELSQVFKDGNQRWTKIMDAEAVDGFINDIFPENGKVNYKKMHDLFDKHGYDRIFKRALGEEGYKAFEQLTKDMLTSESPYKMLRVAKEKGWGDFYKTASSYFLHPNIAKAKLGLDFLKFGYRSAVNAMLDEPKLAFTWKKGIQDLKKGDFAQAEKAFHTLDKEVKAVKSEILPKEETEIKAKSSEPIEAKVDKIEETKQLEAPKKQIELKEPKIEETSDTLNESENVQSKGKTPEEIAEMDYEYNPKLGRKELRSKESKTKPIKSQKNDDQWYLHKNSKKPFSQVPEATGEFIESLVKPGDTFKDLYNKINYDPEAKAIAKHFIDEGYGNIPIELDQYGRIKPFEEIKTKSKDKSTKSIPEETVKQVKRQDISKKGLKEQKKWLIEKLDEAIAKAPESPKEPDTKKLYAKSKKDLLRKTYEPYELITFDVPGDGVMKIRNYKKALIQFRDSVEKKWPDKPLKLTKKQLYG